MGAQNSRAGPGGHSNGQAATETSYYELLGVEEDATSDEIKVLSDEQERAWYDSHRSSIGPTLDGADIFEDIVSRDGKPFKARARDPGLSIPQLFHFFDSSLYTSMDDSKYGFFTVYRGLFDRLAAEEAAWSSLNGDTIEYPAFGDANTPWAPASKQKGDNTEYASLFYRAWGSFATTKDFSWYDMWNTSEAPDRRVRRLMERDNKKVRDDARREYNETVRTLVAFIRKRDPRFKAYKDAQSKPVSNPAPKSGGAQQSPIRNTFVAQEWQKARTNTDDHADLEWGLAENDSEEYECVVCGKSFQSEAGWLSHERSKKHMKEVEKLKREMQAENLELGLDEQDGADTEPPTPIDGEVDAGESESDEPPTPKTSKKSKKKKKKARAMAVEPDPVAPITTDEDLTKPMDGLKIETEAVVEGDDNEPDGEEDNEKGGDKPTLTKREKRRAKEAAKKAKETEAPTPVQSCNVCGDEFEPRTKLFAHIESSGHQLAASEKTPAAGSQTKKNGAKKGKGKGKR